MATLRDRSEWAFFIDGSLYDPDRVDESLWAELLDGRRVMLIKRILDEIDKAPPRLDHPLFRALKARKPGLAVYHEPHRGTWLHDAMTYYVILLMQRRRAMQMLEDIFVGHFGSTPDERERDGLFRLLQRGLGVDGMHLHAKSVRHGADPKAADEILVFLAVMHALLTRQHTAIVTADHDLDIQFHKLCETIMRHYRAMHMARLYHEHPSGFTLREVSVHELAESGMFMPEPAIAATPHRPIETSSWAPPHPDYVWISCMTFQGDYASESRCLAETPMLDTLKMKSKTGGRCTNLFGDCNTYSWRVMDSLKPFEVLIAKDIVSPIESSHMAISRGDIAQTLFGGHVLQRFESSLPDTSNPL
jgi:hypothetical protein